MATGGYAITLTTGDVLFATGLTPGQTATGATDLYGTSGFVTKMTLPKARGNTGSIALDDGTALVLGGGNAGPATVETNVDRWNSTTQWVAAGTLQAARFGPSTTRLPDGKILIAGGSSATVIPNNQLGSAEIYNPATSLSVTTTGSFTPGRFGPVAPLLSNGKVAIVGGGVGGTGTQAILIFDPVTQLFTDGPTVAYRFNHAGARLPDGRILYCGGCTGGSPCEGPALDTCEIFDGTTATATGALTQGGSGMHSMITLPTGKVLLVGGTTSGSTTRSRAELYDPATGQWTATGSLTTGRYQAAIGLLGNGRAVIAGGRFGPTISGSTAVGTAEIYDPGTPLVCKVQQLDGTTNTLTNGTSCDDSNTCTTTDVCASGVCTGTAVANGTVCSLGTCQAGVCVALADAGSDAADATSDASDASDGAVASDASVDASDATTADASDGAVDAKDPKDAKEPKDAFPDGPLPPLDSGKDAAKDTGAPPTPDTGAGTADAGTADGGQVPGDAGGCSCDTASTSPRSSGGVAALLLAFGALISRRRSIAKAPAQNRTTG